MKLTSLLLLAGCLAVCAETEERINKRFAIQPGGKLIVDVDFGAIDVKTNATSEVTVDVVRKVSRGGKADEEAFLRERPVTFSQDGNAVTIHSRARSKISGSWRGKQRTEAKYTLTVPAHYNAQLRTSGGGIRVADCEGALKVNTSGGGIEVSGGAGSLAGDTSGGSVAVKDFRGPVQVETSGGGITIENVVGKVQGSTSGGSISARFSSPLTDPVKLETSGGGVTVRVPRHSTFDLDASTSGGSVSSELPVSIVGKPSRSHLKGPVNGGGKPVVLRSSGGSIQVKKL